MEPPPSGLLALPGGPAPANAQPLAPAPHPNLAGAAAAAAGAAPVAIGARWGDEPMQQGAPAFDGNPFAGEPAEDPAAAEIALFVCVDLHFARMLEQASRDHALVYKRHLLSAFDVAAARSLPGGMPTKFLLLGVQTANGRPLTEATVREALRSVVTLAPPHHIRLANKQRMNGTVPNAYRVYYTEADFTIVSGQLVLHPKGEHRGRWLKHFDAARNVDAALYEPLGADENGNGGCFCTHRGHLTTDAWAHPDTFNCTANGRAREEAADGAEAAAAALGAAHLDEPAAGAAAAAPPRPRAPSRPQELAAAIGRMRRELAEDDSVSLASHASHHTNLFERDAGAGGSSSSGRRRQRSRSHSQSPRRGSDSDEDVEQLLRRLLKKNRAASRGSGLSADAQAILAALARPAEPSPPLTAAALAAALAPALAKAKGKGKAKR
eukprot:tig00000523_g1875.t1